MSTAKPTAEETAKTAQGPAQKVTLDDVWAAIRETQMAHKETEAAIRETQAGSQTPGLVNPRKGLSGKTRQEEPAQGSGIFKKSLSRWEIRHDTHHISA